MSPEQLAAMYPSMGSVPAPPVATPIAGTALLAPAAAAQAVRAETVPPDIQALRDGDPLLKQYPNMYRDAAWESTFAEDLTTPRAEQEAFRDTVHGLCRDVGFDQVDVEHIITAGRAMLKQPPDAAKTESMRAEASRLLSERFGKGAAAALAGARQLAQRDPRMAKMLERTRLGDDPKTVLRLAEQAVRERARGRLK